MSLWRASARLGRPVRAAGQLHEERPVLHLGIEHAGTSGVGQISPQPVALNGDPGVEDVLEELTETLLTRLMRLVAREGEPPAWARASTLVDERPAGRFAGALLEMALLTRELSVRGESSAVLWPAQYATPLQQTVSVLGPEAPWRLEPTVARVRVKTAPGAMSDAALARVGGLGVPVLLDFNASALGAEEVIAQARAVQSVARLDAVEQPFAPGNLAEMARLAERLDVDLSVDEGLRGESDLTQIVRYCAARVLCVKPARVGGYARARGLIERARDLGLRVYLGGFFETARPRQLNRVFAASCVSEPSDIGEVELLDTGPHGPGPTDVPRGAALVAEWS